LSVVIDANLLVVLVTGDERGQLVDAKLRSWQRANETLHAPALMPYEAVNAIVRAAVAANLSAELVEEMWARIAQVPVKLHALQDGAGVAAVARRLKRHSAYDAAYVALAQSLDADLWTFDGPLARNAGSIGLPVRLLAPN